MSDISMKSLIGWPVAAVSAVLLVSSCQSLEELAPPVGAQAPGGDPGDGAELTSLRRGREVYLRHCSSCHAVEAVRAYSPSQWEQIVRRKSGKAGLTPEQAKDLLAYLTTMSRPIRNGMPSVGVGSGVSSITDLAPARSGE